MDCVVYKQVVGCPSYRVGSDGTVWSCLELRRIEGSRGGFDWQPTGPWKQLKPNRAGPYPTVKVYNPNHKRRMVRVGVLVLEVFIGPCPDGKECCHLNGNRLDNRLCNLLWDTHLRNIQDKKTHKTDPSGERHGGHKLIVSQVKEIRKRREMGETYSILAKEFRVHPAYVCLLCKGHRWKEV